MALSRRAGEATQTPATVWPGYVACALGLLYAAISAYWALGGDTGLATVGGAIEDLARTRTPLALAVAWGAAVLKGIAALLALPLVRRWGLRLPRRLLLLACWGASAVLILYGGSFVAVGALVLVGIIPGAPPEQQFALRWHVALWDMWFLLWGLALAAAAWLFVRRTATH